MTSPLMEPNYINAYLFGSNRRILIDCLHTGYRMLLNEIPGSDPFENVILSAKYAFSIEEFWMADLKYPGLNYHVKRHINIMRKIIASHAAYDNNAADRARHIFSHLLITYEKHKLSDDTKFIKYVGNRLRS